MDNNTLLENGSIINEAIRRATEQNNSESQLQTILSYIGDKMHADRAYIFEEGKDGIVSETYEWCANGVDSEKKDLQNIPFNESAIDWRDLIRDRRGLVVTENDPDQSDRPEIYRFLSDQGVHRMIAVPLYIGKDFVGFLGVNNPSVNHMQGSRELFVILGAFTSSIIARRNSERRMRELTEKDPVTGTWNMSRLMDYMEQRRVEHRQRNARDRFQGIIYFNIMQFTLYNDTFGYDAGNECLKKIAGILHEVFETEYITRANADRFIVFYHNSDDIEKIKLAHDIVLQLIPGHQLWLEAGIYYMNSDLSDHITTMCDLAKIACDRIPNHGVRYYMVYSAELRRDLERKKYIQDHIDEAIARGYVQVYYQPVVRALTGKVCNAEALSRWIDPTYGTIPPSEFVPALEEKNLSWKLDRFVIRRVAWDMREMLDAGLTIVPTSINLSRKDFEIGHPISEIEGAVREFELERYAFCIEITESAVMSHPQAIQESIEEFHNAGYEVWMDDFGSGYSSLNALRNFDFDEIKIDMGFMRHLDHKSKDIVKNIVNMAKDLGIRTLCEGVETKEQFEFLKDLGCERIQGYYFGKPMPMETLRIHLKNRNLCLESREEMKLYNSFSNYHFDAAKAFGFCYFDNQNYTVFYLNKKLNKMLEQDGIHGCEDVTKLVSGNTLAFSAKLRTLATSLKYNEDQGDLHFSLNGHSFLLHLMLAAHGKIGRIYIASLTDITEDAEQGGKVLSDSVLRNLVNAYYGIYEIDFDHQTVKIISSSFSSERIGDFVPFQEKMMESGVYWKDRSRFRSFMTRENMECEFQRYHQGSFTDLFRIQREKMGYSWFAFTVIRISEMDQMKCLLCIKPSAYEDTGKARMIAKTVLEGIYPEENPKQKQDSWNSPENLWASMNEQQGIKIFWKDRNRRFVGASRAFLDFYGMTDESEILGKTDEEVGWHIDDTSFRMDEERVLQGETLLHRRGQNVVHGKIYNIVYSKMPAYRNGEICGLIGMFSDESEYLRSQKDSYLSAITDTSTGILNATGGMLTMSRYEENYKASGEDYFIAVLTIRNYWRIRQALGKEAAERVIRFVTQSLQSESSQGLAAARVRSERIAIETKLGADALHEKVEQLISSMEKVNRIGDYHGQPYISYGIASRSETEGIFQTYDLAATRSEGHKEFGTKEVQLNGHDYLDISRDLPTPYVLARCILNSTGDQVVDATFLYVNERYCQMVHRSPEQLIGKNYLRVVPKADPVWLNYAYQAAVLHKEVHDTIYGHDTGMITFFMSPASMPLSFCMTGMMAEKDTDRDAFFRQNWTTDDRILRIVRIINSSMDYRDTMHQVLREIAAIIHPDRVHLIDISASALEESFEWVKDGIPSAADVYQKEAGGILYYASQITAQNRMSIEVTDTEEIRQSSPELFQFLRETGTDRMICAPVYEGGKVIAYLEAENYELNLNMNIRKFMETIAVFISERMVNYHVIGRLDYLSYHDGLTSVMNSHAYKKKKAELQEGDGPVGVIYADMNGLKGVNDRIGHDEGDRRLKYIADILSSFFGAENVYRIGGDEFLVILSDITKEDFETKLQNLKERMERETVISLAIGSQWVEDSSEVGSSIHLADQKMYRNKAAYYKKHDRRRKSSDAKPSDGTGFSQSAPDV